MTPDRLLAHFDRISEAPDVIPRLRQFVFSLAVRGALVEQCSSDEPAVQLLGDRVLPIEDSAAHWALPKGWAWSSLEKLGEMIGGGTPSKTVPEYWDGEIPWVSPKDMKVDRLRDAEDHITPEAIENSSTRLIPPGSLLVVIRGMILIHSFPAALSEVPVTINQDMKAVCPFRSEVAPYLLLLTKGLKPEILNLVDRSTHGTCKLLTNKLFPFPLPLPPLTEQRRIVAKVDELMALCDELEAAQAVRERRRDRLAAASLARLDQPADDGRSNEFRNHVRFHLDHLPRITTRPEQIAAIRQTILNLAVRGALVPQYAGDEPAHAILDRVEQEKLRLVKSGEIKKHEVLDSISPSEIPFRVPSGWAVVRLGTIARKLGAGSTPRGGKSVYQTSGVKFLRSQNVHNDGLRLDDVAMIPRNVHDRMSGTHVQRDDVLLNITGASIGRCALVPEDFDEGNVSQHVAIIRLHDPNLREFIHLSLISPYFQRLIDDVQVGVSREGLSMQRLRQFPMLIPPTSEQERIVAKVDELMAVCDELESHLTTAQTNRRRLLEAILHEALNTPAAEVTPETKYWPLTLVAVKLAVRFPNWRVGGDRKRMVKSLAIAQRHLGVDFGWSDYQMSAGPHNSKLIQDIETDAKAAGLLDVEERTGDFRPYYRYKPTPLPTAAVKQLAEHFGDELDELNRLAELSSHWTSEDAELYATIYAVWNDLLIDKKPVTDAAIITGVRNWSREKHDKFTADDVTKGLAALRESRLIPQGRGPRTRVERSLFDAQEGE